MNATSAATEKMSAVASTRLMLSPHQPRLRIAAAGGHEFAALPQEPASDPDEQQRRKGRSGEVGCRDAREREGEGQVGGAREAELDDGETQEPGLQGWHQRHEREEKEQLQQEHDKDQNPEPFKPKVDQDASPGDLDVLLHHRLRKQLLGLDLDSMLESLAAVVAVEDLLNKFSVTVLSELIVLDARGGRQLQPAEEDLVVVGRARVAGAQRARTGARESRRANQLKHCRPCCLCNHIPARFRCLLPPRYRCLLLLLRLLRLRGAALRFQQVLVDLGSRHAPQLILINVDKHRKCSVAVVVLHVDPCALVEQQLHHLRVAIEARRQQHGASALVLLVEQRALVEQQLHHLRAAELARPHQRGHAALGLLVDRRALVEQQRHHLRVALDARPHQRGHAVLVLLVDRRIIVEQLLHHLRVAGAARVLKWAHGAIERMRVACQVLPRRPVAGLCRSLVASAPSSQSRRVLATAQGRETTGP
eukprot:scaffold13164_cov66-Phaeocystis_antarctica.AAC.2